MICKNCGMQNNDDSKFCISCGSPIQNDNNMINEPMMYNQSLENQMMINNQVINQPQVEGEPMSVQNNNKHKQKPKSNKKLLFIVGGVVLTLIILVVLFVLLSGEKDQKAINVTNLFDLEQPIPVRKDGGYVYIDTKGKMPKNIKYNKANDFFGDFAYVELDDGTSALIDKNQNIKVNATSYYAIEYIESIDSWLIDGVLYDSKLNEKSDKNVELKKQEKGYFTYNNKDYTEYGIINGKGKVVYKSNSLIYSLDVSEYTTESDYGIIVMQEGASYKEYLISLDDGTVVYENKYKDPSNSYSNNLNESSNGVFYTYDNNYKRAETIYIKDKKVVYSIKGSVYGLTLLDKDYLEIDYGYSYEELGKEQRYYYYDIKQEKLLKEKPELEDIEIPEKQVNVKERQIVSCDNGYGLIDDKKVIVPCIYDDIDYLPENVYEYIKQKESKDLMYIKDNNEKYIYDANKRENYLVFEQGDNYEIIDSSNSLFIKQNIYIEDPNSWSDKLNKIVIYNLITKQKIEFDSNSNIEIKTNYFKEQKEGKTRYYNMNFEKIYTEV